MTRTTTPAVNSTGIIRRMILAWILSIYQSPNERTSTDVSILNREGSLGITTFSYQIEGLLRVTRIADLIKIDRTSERKTSNILPTLDNIITIEQCVNMSIKKSERINSHLHFWHHDHHQTHRQAHTHWHLRREGVMSGPLLLCLHSLYIAIYSVGVGHSRF